jgi:hypothetical protein
MSRHQVCENCGYEKWDGFSRHAFAGRESSGVVCWGPKPGTAAYRKIHGDVATTTNGHGSTIAAPVAAAVAPAEEPKPAKEPKPPKPPKEPKPPKVKAPKLSAGAKKLARLGIVRGAIVPAPNPENSPLAKKRARQAARRR